MFKTSEDILAELDCPDYKEQPFDSFKDMLEKKGETVIELIRRLFKKRERKSENETE